MNYSLLYSKLIERAKQRGTVYGYKERHHIIPKALGGDNSASNLVNLTAREHFIAHILLAKIHGGSMWNAIVRFKYGNKYSYYNSKLYEIARKESAKEVSCRFRGVPKSEETKKKLSIAHTGKPKSKEAVEKSRKSRLGMKPNAKQLNALINNRHLAWTPEAQIKKSAKLKGRDVSAWIHKVAEANRGKVIPAHLAKAFGDRVRGKKQSPEQIAKRVASRKATLETQGRTH